MPDEISQANIEDQISPDGEVAETAAEQASTQEQLQQEEPLTLESVRQLLTKEFIPQINSNIQSQVAKGENRVKAETDRRIKERIQGLQANKKTLGLSDEQVQQAQERIVNEETIAAYQPEAQSAQQQSAQEQANRGVDPVHVLNSHISAVFKVAGAEVQKGDPEYKEMQEAVDKAWLEDGPEGLVILNNGVMAAAQKKAERIKAQQKNAAARTVGSGDGRQATNPNDISNINDTTKLYEMGEEQIRKGKRK